MNNHTSIIRIDKDEVFKEISKLTSYMGDKDNQPEAYSKILATDEDRIFFERTFDMALAECRNMLYPYTKNAIPTIIRREICSELLPPNDYDPNAYVVNHINPNEIKLLLPRHFSHITINLIEKLLNEYIINRLMSEWIMITVPEKHSYWIERCASTKKQISTALTARTRPLKRTLRPF